MRRTVDNPQPAAPGRGTTILNVNDADAIRYVLSHALKAAGYTVVEAVNGQEGVDRAAEHPDLILLDVRLPDIDGFRVCEAIKADPNTSNIPVLMISANFVQRSDVEAGLQSGADGYLTHPIDPADLILAVQAVLDAKRTE